MKKTAKKAVKKVTVTPKPPAKKRRPKATVKWLDRAVGDLQLRIGRLEKSASSMRERAGILENHIDDLSAMVMPFIVQDSTTLQSLQADQAKLKQQFEAWLYSVARPAASVVQDVDALVKQMAVLNNLVHHGVEGPPDNNPASISNASVNTCKPARTVVVPDGFVAVLVSGVQL